MRSSVPFPALDHLGPGPGVRRLVAFSVDTGVQVSPVHVDLATKNPEDETQRLIAIGATKVEYREGNGSS